MAVTFDDIEDDAAKPVSFDDIPDDAAKDIQLPFGVKFNTQQFKEDFSPERLQETKEALRTSPLQFLPRIPRRENAGTMEKIGAGAVDAAQGAGEFLTSPTGAAIGLATALFPPLGAAFIPIMTEQAAKTLGEASVTKDPRDITRGTVEAGMAALPMAHEALSRIPDAKIKPSELRESDRGIERESALRKQFFEDIPDDPIPEAATEPIQPKEPVAVVSNEVAAEPVKAAPVETPKVGGLKAPQSEMGFADDAFALAQEMTSDGDRIVREREQLEADRAESASNQTEFAQTPKSVKPSVSPRYERPPDIVDWISGNGKLRRLKPGEQHENGELWRAAQRAYPELFKENGSGPDEVADAYRRETGKEMADDELLSEIAATKARRQTQRKRFGKAVSEASQDANFADVVLQNKRRDASSSKQMFASDLSEGDTFTAQGHRHVAHPKTDPNDPTMLRSVDLKDGPKFGTQKVGPDTVLHIDKGSLRREATSQRPGDAGEFPTGSAFPETLPLEGELKLAPSGGGVKPVSVDPAIKEMGADVYDANPTAPGTYVSNMFAAIDASRAEMGKPPMEPTVRRSWDSDNQRALATMNRDPHWIPNLIKEVTDNPRPLLSWENAGMVWHRAKLKAEADNALTRIAQAFDDGRMDDVQSAKLESARFEDELDALDTAVGRNGTGSEAGRSLVAQKMAAADDFSLVEMRLKKRAANGGKPLTDAQDVEVAETHRKLVEAERKVEELQEARKQDAVNAEIERIKREAPVERFHPKVLEAAERIVSGFEARADAARLRLREKLKTIGAGVDPTILLDVAEIGAGHLARKGLDFARWSKIMLDEFGDAVKPYLGEAFKRANALIEEGTKSANSAVRKAIKKSATAGEKIEAAVKSVGEAAANKRSGLTFYVQKLARAFVEDGITDREKLIDAVHEKMKAFLPDMTRRQAMDAISGYGDFKQLSKDQISVQLRGMKGEMLELSKLEDMALGKPPRKSGVERGHVTEARRQLIKMVNDAKFKFQIPIKDPNTQLRSALDTYKKALTNRISDLSDKLERGDFSKTPRRTLELDSEANRLKAQAEKVKHDFRQALNRDKYTNRTKSERVMDTLVKWRRGFILSGPQTLAKLTSAAIARTITTPLEEAAGEVFHRALPALSKRAPRHGGGFNTKAEVKALSESVTAGMADAWQTLKTGKSQLDYLYKRGSDPGLPPTLIDVFGHIHGMLKAPVKRAEFARSLEKRMQWNAERGVDVTDEFVQARIGLEAFEDADRSIFMQKNILNDAYGRMLQRFEQPEKIEGKPNPDGKPSIGGKALATASRIALPVTKVPSNIVGEIMEYAVGSATGGLRAAKAYRNGIENLAPAEADLIMRHLKKGAVGQAALLFGFFAPQIFGGFYRPGTKKKDAIKPDAMRVGGVNIDSHVLHNQMTETSQLGATIRQVADTKLRKKDKATQGLSNGALAGALGLADATPFVREMTEIGKLIDPNSRQTWINEFVNSLVVPQALRTTAEHFDKDANGEVVKRKPTNITQAVELGIPGLRQNVPKAKK